MAENKKDRWYTVQRNFDFETHDADKNLVRDITPDEWRKEVEQFMHELFNSGKVKQYIMIFHDMDKLETGFKPIHVHMIVNLKNPVRKSAAMTLLNVSAERNIDYAGDKGARAGAAQYLLHITEKAKQESKFIYSERDLISEGGIDYHEMKNNTTRQQGSAKYGDLEAIGLQLSLDIEEEGKTINEAKRELKKLIPDRLLAHKMSHKWKPMFEESDSNYKESVVEDYSSNGRQLLTVMVSGRGGLGKSTLATRLALAIEPHEAPFRGSAPGEAKTADFAGMYKRQKVTILDDVATNQFGVEEFFRTFDPHTYSPVSSRNVDVDWISDTAILTTSISPLRFVEHLMAYSKGGSQYQVMGDNPVLQEGEDVATLRTPLPHAPRLNSTFHTIDKYYQTIRRVKYQIAVSEKHVTVKEFNDDFLAPAYDTIAKFDWDKNWPETNMRKVGQLAKEIANLLKWPTKNAITDDIDDTDATA